MKQKLISLSLASTGEADVVHEDWLHKTWPFGVEQIYLFYGLNERKDVSFFDLIENFMIGVQLTAIYLTASLSVLLLCLLINEITNGFASSRQFVVPRRIGQKIDLAVKSLEIRKLSTIGVFALFVHLFFWLTRLFLQNNIKTNKVRSETSRERFVRLNESALLGHGGH